MILFASSLKKAFSATTIGSIGLVLGLTSFPKMAQAQFTISPQVVELNAKRGQAQGSILMINGASTPLPTKSYITPFTYDRESGFQELKESPQDLTPYVQLYPANVTLAGTEQRRIRFVTRLAPNLPDGEYRAMIFTELNSIEVPKEQVIETGNTIVMTTSVQPRFGVAVYVRKGNISSKLNVENTNWDSTTHQVKVLVKNSGKATAIVQGEWTLKQGDKTIKKGSVQDTTVIAEGDRMVNISMLSSNETNPEKLASGRYQLEGNILWGFNHSQKIPYQVSFEVPTKK